MDATHDEPRLTELDVAGWYVVVVDGPVGTSVGTELAARVRPRLTGDASVALDLRGTVTDGAAVLGWLQPLAAAAGAAGSRLVVVSGSAAVRADLRAAGLSQVYESLDAALGDHEGMLREAGSPAPAPPLHSAAGDALLP